MNTKHTESKLKLQTVLLTLLLVLPLAAPSNGSAARGSVARDQNDQTPRVLPGPTGSGRRRHVRADRPRKGRHSIGRSFSRAGKSAGRGGKRFGQNIGHGRPIRGGKELGKGLGGFGKHTGRGVGRTMRRIFKP